MLGIIQHGVALVGIINMQCIFIFVSKRTDFHVIAERPRLILTEIYTCEMNMQITRFANLMFLAYLKHEYIIRYVH